MSEAKIRLSQSEKELVMNAGLILTKNRILQKVNLLLAGLQDKQQYYTRQQAALLPAAVTSLSPKISRGENYQGLPYLILDYPRAFGKTDVLAVRTLFWWGHFFSVTLHLSGAYKKAAEGKIICAYPLLAEKGYYCCVNEDPWEHHFEAGNYIPVGELLPADFSAAVKERSFIKLSRPVSLEQWEDAEAVLAGLFEQLMELLAD